MSTKAALLESTDENESHLVTASVVAIADFRLLAVRLGPDRSVQSFIQDFTTATSISSAYSSR